MPKLDVVRVVLQRRAMRGCVVLLPVAAIALAMACGSSPPGPPYTAQPTSALSEVPYPPPPARVEAVPKRPKSDAVWIDGEWVWQSRRWAWKPGRWVETPPGARFAPWTTVRDSLGTLFFASGTWRNASGVEVPEPTALAAAGPAPVSVVTPEGEEVRQGPEAPLDAGTRRQERRASNSALEELDASGPFVPDGATMDAGTP